MSYEKSAPLPSAPIYANQPAPPLGPPPEYSPQNPHNGAWSTGPPPMPPSAAPVITSQPMSVPFLMGKKSVELTCPNCNSLVTTSVRRQNATLGAWAGCCAVASVGCFCGCCCLPFMIEEFSVFYHSCPQCKGVVGLKKGSASLYGVKLFGSQK